MDDIFRGWVWQILYGVFYKGQLIDSRTWPNLDLTLLQSRLYSGVPLHFLSPYSYNTDYSFYLYLQNKVSWLNYYKYEWALKQAWLQLFGSSKFCISYRKNLSDTPKYCCNYPTIRTVSLYHTHCVQKNGKQCIPWLWCGSWLFAQIYPSARKQDCTVVEPPRDKTNKMICAPSEDSDQPGHLPSLISLRCALKGVARGPSFLCANSEDSDQTGRMPRLIWVFAGCTCHFVGFVTRRLTCCLVWFSSHIWPADH